MTRRRVGGFDELPAVPGGGVTISVGKTGMSASVGDNGPRARPKGKGSKG